MTLYLGDCLEILPGLKGVNVVVTDPPYGTTDCDWDVRTDPAEMLRVMLSTASSAVMTACQPFTSHLIVGAGSLYRHSMVWDKGTVTGMLNAKKMPLRAHEDIVVFGEPKYRPQLRARTADEMKRLAKRQAFSTSTPVYSNFEHSGCPTRETHKMRWPDSVIRITGVINNSKEKLPHPTQKPIALMRYLIESYSDEWDVVADPYLGSGTTAIAALRSGRRFVGIEKDPTHYATALKRITDELAQGDLFLGHNA